MFSLAAGLPSVCGEQSCGENESRILRGDRAEPAGKPAGTPQCPCFLIYGSGHSDSRGTKSAPQLSSRKGGLTRQPVAAIFGAISSLTSSDRLTVGSVFVHPVKPPNPVGYPSRAGAGPDERACRTCPIKGNVKRQLCPSARCRSFFVSAFSPTV